MPRPILHCLAALGVMLLTACLPTPVNLPTAEAEDLFPIIFPGWQKNNHEQILDLGPLEASPGAERQSVRAKVHPLFISNVGLSHLVLVTKAIPVGENGAQAHCDDCPIYVGAYFFKRTDGRWTLSARHPFAIRQSATGPHGPPRLAFPKSLEPSVTVENVHCTERLCNNWLTSALLTPDRVTLLTEKIPLSSSNDHLVHCPGGGDMPLEDPFQDRWPACHHIEGSWRAMDDRIQITFNGWRRPAGRDETPPEKMAVAGAVTYVLKNGRLERAEGDNPVRLSASNGGSDIGSR